MISHKVFCIADPRFHGEWQCLCGNTATLDGFHSCDHEGDEQEPDEKWGGLFCCNACGLIISKDGYVIGVHRDGYALPLLRIPQNQEQARAWLAACVAVIGKPFSVSTAFIDYQHPEAGHGFLFEDGDVRERLELNLQAALNLLGDGIHQALDTIRDQRAAKSEQLNDISAIIRIAQEAIQALQALDYDNTNAKSAELDARLNKAIDDVHKTRPEYA